MTSIRSPESAFVAHLQSARTKGSPGQQEVTKSEATIALQQLVSLSPAERVRVVNDYLGSNAGNLSSAAQNTLRDFVNANGPQQPLPVAPAPTLKFLAAIDQARTHGKVKGQITKQEIQRAFKHVAGLPVGAQAALAQQLLNGPNVAGLSKAALQLVRDIAAKDGGVSTQALGEEGGSSGVSTEAVGEEGGGVVTTQALGEEGGGVVTTQALGEEGGGSGVGVGVVTTQALGEEGGSGMVTTQALGEEGGGSGVGVGVVTTQALGEEGGGSGVGVGVVTTQSLGEEGGGSGVVTTQALGEEGGGSGVVTTQALGEEGGV